MIDRDGSSTDARIVREPRIVEKLVFLDGLTGTGKTMMGPLLGSLDRVELLRIEHIYEYICILDFLGKMERDAACAMLGMYADLATYDSMIARETNFRPSDLSGVFSNPGALRYLRRLLAKDGDAVAERIRTERPIVQVLTHQALPAMGAAFDRFGDRLCVIEMVRHPLYLLEHWHSYIDRHGTDARDFTIWLGHGDEALPWFASGWEERYAASGSFDRVIYSIDFLVRGGDAAVEQAGPQARERVLAVPFERFVLEPEPWIGRICELLGTRRSPTTARVLRKQKVPRGMVAAGPDKEIYRRYAWSAPERDATERSVYEQKRALAEQHASPEALEALDRLSAEYEAKWGLWF